MGKKVFILILIGLAAGSSIGVIEKHLERVQQLEMDLAISEDVIAKLQDAIAIVDKELELRQDITSLVVDAAREYKLDPRLLAIVIKSESNFRPNPNHKLPHVVGPGGINVKMHTKLKHNAHSYVGNIYSVAEVLSKYMLVSDSLTLALTQYKGVSPLGLSQAKQIVGDYNGKAITGSKD